MNEANRNLRRAMPLPAFHGPLCIAQAFTSGDYGPKG
jgi:hypothetical protein